MQNITTTIYERYCTQFTAITKCWKKHRVTKITGSLKPFGIKQLNQLHRGVSDVEAYQQCHHSNILGWVSNPMNSNPMNLVQSALHGLFGMWRSMTVVGSPDGSGCRTLSAFAWRCVTELKSRSWSALLALILAHNTSWSVFEPGPQPADWCHPSSLNKNCHSIPTPDLMRRKNHSSLKPSYLRDPGPSWHQGSSSSSERPVRHMMILTFFQHSFQDKSTLPQRPHPSSKLHCCDGHPPNESTYAIPNITTQVQSKDPRQSQLQDPNDVAMGSTFMIFHSHDNEFGSVMSSLWFAEVCLFLPQSCSSSKAWWGVREPVPGNSGNR